MLRLIAQVSDSLGLRLGLRICISVKFTADFGANGLEITLSEQCSLPYLPLSYLILPCFDGAHFLKESFVECAFACFLLITGIFKHMQNKEQDNKPHTPLSRYDN